MLSAKEARTYSMAVRLQLIALDWSVVSCVLDNLASIAVSDFTLPRDLESGRVAIGGDISFDRDTRKGA